MGICEIRLILCACVAFTSILNKPWIYSIPTDAQEGYEPVTKCTYWIVLGYFKNWTMIQLSHKSTTSNTFDEIHQVVLDGINDNMT